MSSTPPGRLSGLTQAALPAKAATAPLHFAGKQRKTLEYIRMSRSELDAKERTISSLRSENIKLQASVRELKNLHDSHSTLETVCSDLAQCLGCSVEGVATETVRDILHSQTSTLMQERQLAQQQLRRTLDELEKSRSEVATVSVQVTSLESQLQETRTSLASRDSTIQSLQNEVERLRGSEAKNTAVLQSLRQRLTELEGMKGGEEAQQRITELHTDIGRLKKTLNEKEEAQKDMVSQLEVSQADVEDARQRIAHIEEMYEDLCSQLAGALQIEESTAIDNIEHLISEVGRLAQDYPQLKLRNDTLTKTLKTCELDSRASRETILRLVSEAKKQERLAEQLLDLQQIKMEQETLLESLERERDGYQERLVTSKETMAAQELELKAKEARVSECVSSWQSLKRTADAERELLASEQQRYDEVCRAVASILGSSSTEPVHLLQSLEQVVKNGDQLKQELDIKKTEKEETSKTQSFLQTQLSQVEDQLVQEKERVKQLKMELETETVAREEQERKIEREQEFYQRLSRTLKLDPVSNPDLCGDLNRDAILARAEQITKQDAQAVAGKQSAYYSIQRQLKTCKQTLESKEMYCGLLQKKASNLEEKVQQMSQREAQLETTAGKSKKLEKQVERLRARNTELTRDVDKLRAENKDITSLKTQCKEQEEEVKRLSTRVNELSQARSDQARQLAEARVRVQSLSTTTTAGSSKEKKEETREIEWKKQLGQLQEQLEKAREAEKKFNTFQEAVQRLLSDAKTDKTRSRDEDAPNDYKLIEHLELMVAEHRDLRDTVHCLGSSLQQLEQGFRNGYSDTMAILHTKA